MDQLLSKGSDGPLDLITGLPAHVMIVHAAVVLVPLTAVGVVLIVVSALWRERLRWPVLAVGTAATVSVFAAATSGEAFLDRFDLESDPLVQDHQVLGEAVRWWVLVAWVLVVAYVLLERRVAAARTPVTAGTGKGSSAVEPGARPGPRDQAFWVQVVAVVLVLAWVAATVQVSLTGHSGSRAVWERQTELTR